MHQFCTRHERMVSALMKEPNDKSNKAKGERQRCLNVIYFIDSNRTHTFKLSLKSAVVIASILGGMLIWSILGSYLLLDTSLESTQKNQRIRSLLATIFTYQTRYDEVYERSYPDLSHSELTSHSEEPAPASEPEDQDISPAATEESPHDPDHAVSLAAKASPSDSKASTVQTSDESQKESHPGQPPIGIEDVETKDQENLLEFSFSLKNLASPELASGYVIGVGSFIDESGQAVTILSPPEVRPDKKIPIYSLSKNHRFSIRYYKKKTLQFSKPDAKKGQFQSVKIVIGDGDGNRKEIVYNLKNDKIDSVQTSEGPGLKTQ